MAARRFPRRAPAVHEPVPEVVAVVQDHLAPALCRLEAAAIEGDLDEIHACALELSMSAASIASACAYADRAAARRSRRGGAPRADW